MKAPTTSLVGFLLSRPTAILGSVGLLLAFVLSPQGSGAQACAFHLLTASPCPGCGLTRSVCNTAHGDLLTAWAYHPFGIPVFLAFALCGVSLLLPTATREALTERALPLERTVTWILWVGLLGTLVYGLGRLLAWWAWGWRPPVPL